MTTTEMYSRYQLPAEVTNTAREAEATLSKSLDERRLSHELPGALLSLRRSLAAMLQTMEAHPAPDVWMLDYATTRIGKELDRIVEHLVQVAWVEERRIRDHYLTSTGVALKQRRLMSNGAGSKPV